MMIKMIKKIHHLHCGTLCPLCAPLFAQKGMYAQLVCHCLLLETEQGLVLIDTGFGMQDYLQTETRLGKLIARTSNIQSTMQNTALAHVRRLGFKAQDVRHILVTHLDFDHAGGISDFPQATIHILSSEYNASLNLKKLKHHIRYRSVQFQQHRYWNFIEPTWGEAWFNLQKVQGFKLLQDDLLMIPLLGHTAGHCGFAIRQAEGWLLFCGDAYYQHQQIQARKNPFLLGQVERLFAENNHQRLQTLAELRELSHTQPQIDLIFSHDPHDLRRFIQNP